jgi:Stage II sporulation protein M
MRTTIPAPRQRPARLRLRPLAYTLAVLTASTGLGVALELADHRLGASVSPHPTLRPTAQAIASIFETNLRVLAAPFLLIVFRFHTTRAARLTGDLVIAAILAANALHVGLAIGRWQTRLLPYLPHLPLEYTAAALATRAWLSARRRGAHGQPGDARATILSAAGAVVLLLAAAVVEVLLTPHAR